MAAEFVIGVVCLAVSWGAGEAYRGLGRRLLAEWPDDLRERADVRERYASLDQSLPMGEGLFTLIRAGWTLFFIGVFALLALADFELVVRFGTAAVLAIGWATIEFGGMRRDEIAFQEAIGVTPDSRSRAERARILFALWILHMIGWLGWLLGSALMGSAIGSALS